MAHIQERRRASGDTVYRVMFRIEGRQQSETFDTRAAADEFAELIERLGPDRARQSLSARLGTTAPTLTVAAWVGEHIAGLPGITGGTRHSYERMLRLHIEPTLLGSLPLTAVTRDHVLAWAADLTGQLGAKTIRNIRGLLSAALSHAVDDGLIAANPVRNVRVGRTVTREMTTLSTGEFAILLGAIEERYQPLIATLAGTGLRWSEATALQVGDVHLDDTVPILRITRAWKHTGTRARALGPPKSKAGRRTVALPPQVVASLRPLIADRPADAFVFTAARGGPLRHDHFYERVWRPTLDALASKRILTKRPRIHDLRHTHASWQIAAGVPLPVLQRRLGHTSIVTTVDTYGHMAPDDLIVTAAAASLSLVEALPELEG